MWEQDRVFDKQNDNITIKYIFFFFIDTKRRTFFMVMDTSVNMTGCPLGTFICSFVKREIDWTNFKSRNLVR